MISPLFLIPRIGPVACQTCGKPPGPILKILGQRFVPLAGTSHVTVRIDFECPICESTCTATKILSRESVMALVNEAIDNHRCAVSYLMPIEVPVPLRPRPSIRMGTPPTLISVEELESARRYPARTSFKCSSKSWRELLRQLDVIRNKR